MSATSSEVDTVIAERADGVLTLTLSHPGKRNALSSGMYEALSTHVANASIDDSIHAVIIRGGGDEGFAAGTDISSFADFDGAADGLAYERRVGAVLRAIQVLPMPTIAVVRGAAVGAGLAIAASCDIVIAERSAVFGAPIARTLGNCLPAPVVSRLMSRMGTGVALGMLLTAALVPASRMYGTGFVHEIADEEQLDGVVSAVVRGIGRSAPLSLRSLKATVSRIESVHEVPSNDDLLESCYGSADFTEGVEAFLQKRHPNWKGI